MDTSFIVKLILISHLLTVPQQPEIVPMENTVVLDSIESVQDSPEFATTFEETTPIEVKEITYVMPHIEKMDAEMYTTTSLNVRIHPDKTSEKLGSIPSATKVKVTGICNNNWYKIEFNGGVGFVNGKYLTKAPVYTGTIKTNGNIDYSLIKLADDYYNLVPEHTRNHFSASGWQIIMTTEHLGQRFFDGESNILAVTSSDDKAIFLDNREGGAESIIHEFGHYIDYQAGFVSYTKEFAAIFMEEAPIFRTVHITHEANTQNPMEYFAEFYQEYILHPEKIKDICPKTHEFVERYSNLI